MKRYLVIFLALPSILLIVGFTSNYPSELDRLRGTIKTQLLQINILQSIVTQLQSENKQLVLSTKEDKYILEAVSELTAGASKSNWADPRHLRHVMSICQKYEYIVKDVKDREFANWKFVFAIVITDTGANPNHIYYNKDNTTDIGLGDLNTVVRPTVEKMLPENLRYKPWQDCEKSIAGRYYWIVDRERIKQPWCIITKRGWSFYSRIAKIEVQNGNN